MKKTLSFISVFFLLFLGLAQTSFAAPELFTTASVQGSEIFYSAQASGLSASQTGGLIFKIFSGNAAGDLLSEEDVPFTASSNGQAQVGPLSWLPSNTNTNTFHVRAFLYTNNPNNPIAYNDVANLQMIGSLSVVQNNIALIQNPSGAGMVEQVEYEIQGEGFTPGAQRNITIEIREGDNLLESGSGSLLHTQTNTVTTNNDGSLNFYPQPFIPNESLSIASGGETSFIISVYLNNPSATTPQDHSVASVSGGVITLTDPVEPDVNNCQDSGSIYCLLEPIGTPGNTPLVQIDTTTNGIGNYLNIIFQIGVALAGIFGVLMIVVGGFTYMTSDAYSKKTDGKEQIKNALLGILLALTSWLLLNTISSNLIDFEIGVYQTNIVNNPLATVGISGCAAHTVNGSPITQNMSWPDDSAQKAILDAGGVSIASTGGYDQCATVGQSGCTSVYYEGAAQDTPELVVFVKDMCDSWSNGTYASGDNTCNVVVTGGSECWGHMSHGPTSKVLDFRANSTVPKFNAFVSSFGSTNPYTIPNVGLFTLEGAGSNSNTTAGHWHVELN